MNRIIGTLAYGFLIWWLWFGFVGLSQLIPESVRALPFFALVRLLVLVLLVVAFAVDYLRRVERSSAGEGLVVGVAWMALMVANNIGHFLLMAATFDPATYFSQAAWLYAFIPLITVMLFSGLMRAQPRTN